MQVSEACPRKGSAYVVRTASMKDRSRESLEEAKEVEREEEEEEEEAAAASETSFPALPATTYLIHTVSTLFHDPPATHAPSHSNLVEVMLRAAVGCCCFSLLISVAYYRHSLVILCSL